MLAQGLKSGDEAMVYGVFSQAERGQSEKGLADTLEKEGLKVDRLEITHEANSDMKLAVPVLAAYIQAHPNLKAIGTQHGSATGEDEGAFWRRLARSQATSLSAASTSLRRQSEGLKSACRQRDASTSCSISRASFRSLQCVMTAKYKMPGLSLYTVAGTVTQ